MGAPEIFVFSGFILFIAIILTLDLGIFDRKSHEVKFREALVWTFVWVCFAIGFYFLILTFWNHIHGAETKEQVMALIEKYRH